MAKTKHVADASQLIDDYFDGLPAWSKKICNKLRQVVISSDPHIIEDWKWGPNFYCEGMVCGMAAFQKHVALVFFYGALINDKYKLFRDNGTLKTRTIIYKNISEINEEQVLDYLFQAIDNNRKGKKIVASSAKVVKIPSDLKKELQKNNLIKVFDAQTLSRRKELVTWLENAKKEETRSIRIDKVVDLLIKKTS